MARDGDLRAGRLLEPTIRRYDKEVRRRLRKMARGSSRLGDLIVAFPAAAYALAIGRGEVAARGEAVRLVKDGASLRNVASALDLPGWTRRLPPEAFRQTFGALPDGPEAARRFASLQPEEGEDVAYWFEWIAAGQAAGGAAVAFWAAQQQKTIVKMQPGADLMGPIGLWIWLSARPELKASRAIARGFTPTIRFEAACHETAGWLERLVEVYARRTQNDQKSGAWFKPQSVGGYKFSPRRTPEELMREGQVMNHCVGTYAGLVQNGVSLIYAIRRGGSPVATLEIRARPDGSGRGYISQLQGPSNSGVAPAVWKAAEAWLKNKGRCPLRPQGAPLAREIDLAKWRELVEPIRQGAAAPAAAQDLLPPEPSDQALYRLARLRDALDYFSRANR